MYHNVEEHIAFYYRSPLGRITKQRLQSALRELVKEPQGGLAVGFGFTPPFIDIFAQNYDQTLNIMPEDQGAQLWATQKKHNILLASDSAWPLRAGVADMVLTAHALENSMEPALLLDEITRVSAQSAPIVFILPRRGSLWSVRPTTPFGQGRPFSRLQIESLLRKHGLRIVDFGGALYAPPVHNRLALQFLQYPEWGTSVRTQWRMSGALIVVAQKELSPKMIKNTKRPRIFGLPEMSPVT